MNEFISKYKGWMFMALALVLNLIFGVVVLLPAFQVYISADEQLTASEAILEATQAASGDEVVILQAQINRLNETFSDQVNGFVQETQVEDILNHLFTYADQTGVVMATMMLQPSTANGETVYNRIFRLQLEGDPTGLMNFIVHFQEASLPGVQIQNPLIAQNQENATLSMEVVMVISPLADGSALANIPLLTMPEPVSAFATEVPITETAPEVITITNQTCGDAPDPWFTVGDTVVVDFNTQTTLRILEEPRLDGGDAVILAMVADNAILQIINGPVCGLWESKNVWYWQVEYGSTIGWAGEANAENRWMCPVSQPECT